MKKYIISILNKQLIEQFAKDEGINTNHLKGILHPKVIVSQRYWKKHLAPTFYKQIYHNNQTK